MNTRDLVEKLTAKFGEIERIIIDAVELNKIEDDAIVMTGVLVAITKDGKALCGMEVINTRCSFKNGIYSCIPVGLAITNAIIGKPDIYAFFSYETGISYMSVPCEFDNIDINKFTIVGNVEGLCPFKNTEKCPLYRYRIQNQQKDEKPRIPIII